MSQDIQALGRNQYLQITTRINKGLDISFNFEVIDWTNKQEEIVTSINVYNTLDESILTKKDTEMLFSVSSSKDTTFIHRKDFKKGFLLYEYIYKITDDYISTLSNAYNWSFTDSILFPEFDGICSRISTGIEVAT